jgi:hypothetical protein
MVGAWRVENVTKLLGTYVGVKLAAIIGRSKVDRKAIELDLRIWRGYGQQRSPALFFFLSFPFFWRHY